jgi:glucose-6-phosphate isomerase
VTVTAIGPENFRAMLAGFRAMDEHFHSAPLERNLPVLMGLLVRGLTIATHRYEVAAAILRTFATWPPSMPAR